MSTMDSEDVRFPWEDPDDEPSTPPSAGEGGREGDTTLAGAPHAGTEEAETADEPWIPGAASADSDDDEPWAAAPVDSSPAPAEPAAPRERPIASREYYSISEVCDLVDLKPHVLRYWETQFAVLNPSKNRSGNRVYQRKEIKLIQLVKHLLYDEKYTVEGAKQKLEQLRRGGELQGATTRALDSQTIDMLRSELRRLAELLAPPEPA